MKNNTKTKTMCELLIFEPTKEQINMLNAIQEFVEFKNKQDFFVATGSAGTGKSSIMKAVVEYLDANNINTEIAAPTGRAARIMTMKTKDIATTLHSLLFSINEKKESPIIEFSVKQNNFDEYTIFIIDEASMVGNTVNKKNSNELLICDFPILQTIVNFVKTGNSKNKVIFIGDRAQLPPINEENSPALMPDYLRTYFGWKGQEMHLTEVMRQANSSPILHTATLIRESIFNNAPFPKLPFERINSLNNKISNYIADLKKVGPNHVISIACTNKQNAYFNKRVRLSRFGNGNKPLCVGDVLCIKQNWSDSNYQLYNGDLAMVEAIDYNLIEKKANATFVPVRLKAKDRLNQNVMIDTLILLDILGTGSANMGGEKEKDLYSNRHKENKLFRESRQRKSDIYLNAIRADYGYSITCHSAQGSEWDKVYLNNFFVPCKKWIYTSITRAKQQLILI